jgi:hypothetical protein
LTGLDALSVDSAITRFTCLSMQASMTFIAPMMLVFTYSNGLYSAAGTIFSAAAWMTYSTPSRARLSRSRSRTSPMKKRTRGSSAKRRAISACFISSRE